MLDQRRFRGRLKPADRPDSLRIPRRMLEAAQCTALCVVQEGMVYPTFVP